jgi:hypothetical protein
LSKASTRMSLQHSEQSPQLRPGTTEVSFRPSVTARSFWSPWALSDIDTRHVLRAIRRY